MNLPCRTKRAAVIDCSHCQEERFIVRIEITSSKNNMQFKVSEDAIKKIAEWLTVIDEEAYDYQIRTGLFFKGSKNPIDDSLLNRIKQRAERDGVKRPYEGASGGETAYTFSLTDKGPMLKAYHYLTKRTLTIKDTPAAGDKRKKQELTTMYSISESEFRRLEEWKQTEEDSGDDYVYSFGPTSIGISVKVRNHRTKAVIDLTDYDSW